VDGLPRAFSRTALEKVEIPVAKNKQGRPAPAQYIYQSDILK
jgi:hypothetical protein